MTQTKKRDLLETFFKSHTRMQFKKGETIVRPEDDPSGVFLIEWGFVKACVLTKYGEENLLLVRSSGSVFPLIWAFIGEHGNSYYEAMEETSLWRVSRAEYLEFLEENPEVMPIILDMVMESYRLHSERVMTLSYRTARERIVSFLFSLSERFGIYDRKSDTTTIHAPFRQADIASSVNATRETTSREINALKQRGLIDIQDHKIIIKNEDELRAIL